MRWKRQARTAGAAASDQTFGLERLDGGRTELLVFGIQQMAEGATDAMGLQGAFEVVRLQQHRQARQGAFIWIRSAQSLSVRKLRRHLCPAARRVPCAVRWLHGPWCRHLWQKL